MLASGAASAPARWPECGYAGIWRRRHASTLASMLAPQLYFMSVGPLKPMFDAEPTPELLAAIRFAGGLLMFMAPVLFVVRWNVLNGKAGALGMIIAAANTAMVALSMDGFAFVLRGWYLFVVMFLLAARHLAFNANPMLTSADLLEKERKRAEKADATPRSTPSAPSRLPWRKVASTTRRSASAPSATSALSSMAYEPPCPCGGTM